MSAQTAFRPYVLDALGRETFLPNLTARARQIMPGDFLLNAADEPVVLVTKVEVLHGARPRVRVSGVTTPRASQTYRGRPLGARRGFVKTLPASAVARITRPVLVG